MNSTFVDPPQSRCGLGVARGDITPPVGIYHRMWGAARHDQSVGVHRPLTASVLVFEPPSKPSADGRRMVLVALDHCLLGESEVDSLISAISTSTGIDRREVVVVFSHTHAAGLMLLDRAELPGGDLIEPYLGRVNQVVTDLVTAALRGVTDATISYGVGRCDLAAHRDFWDAAAEQWVCGFHPEGPADDTVAVARATNDQGDVLATVVNYACHPTTLAWDNQLISPDYPGAMREVVEQATGAPCVFLQGASGDLGPREGFVGDTQVADRNGQQLGYAALSALTALPTKVSRYEYQGPVISGATIGVWNYNAAPSERVAATQAWNVSRRTLSLPYRPELPKLGDVQAERERLLLQEAAALESGDTPRAADLRALIERATRLRARLRTLPAGDAYPFETIVWRLGDAVWVAARGEPYNVLQRELRSRFPRLRIIVCALTNSWGASYLPPAELYGTGIYQESIAVLARGSLERLIDAVASQIDELV